MDSSEIKKLIESDKYLVGRKDKAGNEEKILLNEVHFYCPKCGKLLVPLKKKTKSVKLYEIAHIFPCNPSVDFYSRIYKLKRLGDNSESLDNLIILCFDCHAAYDSATTAEEYMEMVSLKEKYIERATLQQISNSMNLEDDIEKIIKALSTIDCSQLEELKLKPISINNKIPDSCHLLKQKIIDNVRNYYYYIKNIFSEEENKGVNFDLIASQFKSCFIGLSKKTVDLEWIFNEMVNWLMNKISVISSSKSACEAVVSYFVQNCEVFNEITK
ncbi:MAG: HNH endonuclease [Bacilli bacterium]|nr:HNH endonuclease [Bacilli bacterium]